MYLELSFVSIHQQCMWFWIDIEHILMKITGKIKLVHELDLVYHHLYHTNRFLVTNQEPTELCIYTIKPVSRTSFETSWGKLQNLLGMKLTNDIILLLLSVVDDFIFVHFLRHTCWNWLNQWICFVVVIGLPVQLKWILEKSSIVSCKSVCGECTAVRE